LLSSREKISVRQVTILFLLFVYSISIRIFPTYAAKTAERAGWLTPVVAMLPFICLIYTNQALFKIKKNVNLSDIIIKVFGKIIGTIILTVYLIWTLLLLGIVLRYFSERFLSSILPNTPMNFLSVTIMAAVFYTLRHGIVYIVRTAEFFFLIIVVVYISVFLFIIPNIEVINLFPVTHYDVWPLMKASVSILGVWSMFTLFFFFGDKINDKEHIKRFGMHCTLYLVIASLMLLIETIGVYGYSVMERVSLPYIFAIKSISILETIERIESVALAFWVIADYLTISALVYVAISIIKSLFSVSEEKPFISSVSIFAFVFSNFVAHNRFELENFTNNISLPGNIILGFIFPLVILIVGKVRKKV